MNKAKPLALALEGQPSISFPKPEADMDLSKITMLIEFVGRSNVSELSVKDKDVSVHIVKGVSTGPVVQTGVTEAAQPQAEVKAPKVETQVVKAPVYGVLYLRPKPGEPVFVSAGQHVVEGQTLFIIEAMKVMNKVTAPCSGRVIFAYEGDGHEVDAGFTLGEIAVEV